MSVEQPACSLCSPPSASATTSVALFSYYGTAPPLPAVALHLLPPPEASSHLHLFVIISLLLPHMSSLMHPPHPHRSEYRLLLRGDNADRRLTPLGRELGLVGDERWAAFTAKQTRIEQEKARLAGTRVTEASPLAAAVAAASGQALARPATLEELLRRPHVHSPLLAAHGYGPDPSSGVTPADAEAAEIDIKYAGFVARQEKQLVSLAAKAGRRIPEDTDYSAISTLSLEAREKLTKFRPADIGQAGRIGGVSPADVAALLLHLEVQRRRGAASAAAAAAAADGSSSDSSTSQASNVVSSGSALPDAAPAAAAAATS